MGIYAFLLSKNIALRFFFPALVLFIIFTLVPILYGIYISLTNLKTGHLLSRSEVVELITQERQLSEHSRPLQVDYFQSYNSLIVDLPNESLRSLIPLSELKGLSEVASYKLEKSVTQNITSEFKKLSFSEIWDLKPQLEKITWLAPNNEKLSYFRVDQLAELEFLFSYKENQLIENRTLAPLVEDINQGQFILNNKSFGPGYFTYQGFQNYIDIFKNKELRTVFSKSILWTLSWSFFSVLLTFILGSSLAIFLADTQSKMKNLYRAVFIIPYSIPFFISVLIFKGYLNKDFGVINATLSLLHIEPIAWLEQASWARLSVLFVNLWLGFPYMFLVITGIIQSISPSIYEAAKMDGANRWQIFQSITLPMIIHSMIPIMIGSFAFNLNNFVGIYLLTGGGPVIANIDLPIGETDLLISYTYRLAFEGSAGQNFSLAASISVLIFLFMACLTWLHFKFNDPARKR